MTFPKPDDDAQALANLAEMHRWNEIAAQPGGWPTPHITVEQRTVEVSDNPESGPFSSSPGADAEFRRALGREDYPRIPPAVVAALGAADRLRDLAAALGAAARPLYGDVVLSVVEELLAGRPVDSEKFSDDVLEAHRNAEVAPVFIRLHSSMRQRLNDGWPGVIAENLPALLGGLRDQLEELLTEAQAAYAVLGELQIDNPLAVAGATGEQREALLALDDLASRYDRLRNAQQAALAAASPDRLPGYRASEQRAVEPTTWAGVFDLGLHEFSEVRLRGAIGSTVTGTARLSQVVRRHDVWLPDRTQLDQAYNELFSPRATANDGGPDAA